MRGREITGTMWLLIPNLALVAGLTDHVWSLWEWLTFPVVHNKRRTPGIFEHRPKRSAPRLHPMQRGEQKMRPCAAVGWVVSAGTHCSRRCTSGSPPTSPPTLSQNLLYPLTQHALDRVSQMFGQGKSGNLCCPAPEWGVAALPAWQHTVRTVPTASCARAWKPLPTVSILETDRRGLFLAARARLCGSFALRGLVGMALSIGEGPSGGGLWRALTAIRRTLMI